MADDETPEIEQKSVPEPTPVPDVKPESTPVPAARPASAEPAPPVTKTPASARGQAARRIALLSARLVTGLVAVVVAVVVIGAVALVPIPDYSTAVPSQLVTPEPAALQRVCAGSVLRLGNEAGQDAATPSAVGRPAVVSAASGTEIESGALDASASDPSVLTAASGAEALIAGAQSQSLASRQLRGLAVDSCREPSSSSWIVAGDTTTGRTALLTLSNPTDVDATVALRIWGEAGAVSAPGMTGIVVAARSQQVLPLAGFALNIASTVIEVESRGGQVVASLQQSIIRAVDPGGIEIVGETHAPATSLAIPGVAIVGGVAVEQLVGREGYQDLTPVLRVVAPGESDTSVRVSLVPETVAAAGMTFEVPLTAGKVLDIPLQELAPDYYTVKIESDVPVVAGVRSAVALPLATADPLEAPITDLAWFAAPSPLPESVMLTVPSAPGPLLHLMNTTSADSTVEVAANGTASGSVVVAAGTTVQVPLTSGVAYRLDGIGDLLGSVTLVGSGVMSSFLIDPPRPVSGSIVVRP